MSALIAVVAASLLGSLHCVGMCGPLAAFAVGDVTAVTWSQRIWLHAAYHGGRLVTYSLLGAICGVLGATVNLGMARLGVFHAAALLAGAMMILAGAATVLRYYGVRLPQAPLPARLRGLIAAGQRAAIALRPRPRALTIGLLAAMLPCGWLYMFAVVAAGTGNAWTGMAVMAAFWVGSVPALLGLGIGVQAFTGTLGRRIPLFTAVVIIFLGIATLAVRMTIPEEVFAAPVAIPGCTDTAEPSENGDDTIPPCCRGRRK